VRDADVASIEGCSGMSTTTARIVLLLGGFYLAVGIVFGELAGRDSSHDALVAWRRGAWLVSAFAFATHLLYERVSLRSSPMVAALHAALAAALGAFGLAAAANVHAFTVPPRRPSLLLVLSLAIWPLMTVLPAFLVGLVAALLFGRIHGRNVHSNEHDT
jgi:hypothetical protein